MNDIKKKKGKKKGNGKDDKKTQNHGNIVNIIKKEEITWLHENKTEIRTKKKRKRETKMAKTVT